MVNINEERPNILVSDTRPVGLFGTLRPFGVRGVVEYGLLVVGVVAWFTALDYLAARG